MRRLKPNGQRGFGLLVFVIAISVVCLSIVLGYSSLMTREEANRRPAKLTAALEAYREKVQGFYLLHAAELDAATGTSAPVTAEDILVGASIPRRYGLQAELSNVLNADTGLKHRRFVMYFPSLTEGTNPPDLAAFKETGVFNGCADAAKDCTQPAAIVLDSLDIHKEALQETQRRLERVALKAQAYFKARMLQDPEKNISVNYFRPPFGGCSPIAHELPCLDTYLPLATFENGNWAPLTTLPGILGLGPDELVNAWGYPIEASNKTDSETGEPPYTMVFRSPSPFGGYFTVKAVQQI